MNAPRAWSKKDERMYEKIRKSSRSSGADTDRAEEIAARTVNKHRREEGRTKSGRSTSSGTGNPTVPLEERTKQELYNQAKKLDLPGRSTMSKAELVSEIRQRS